MVGRNSWSWQTKSLVTFLNNWLLIHLNLKSCHFRPTSSIYIYINMNLTHTQKIYTVNTIPIPTFMMMTMMMNCFCCMFDQQKMFVLIYSRNHCLRSSPSLIPNTLRQKKKLKIKKLCQMCKIGRRDNNKMFWKIVTSEKFFSNDYKKKKEYPWFISKDFLIITIKTKTVLLAC